MLFKSDYNFPIVHASLLLLFSGIMLASCTHVPENTLTALQTPGVKYRYHKGETGHRTYVTLPDSSHVILNASSVLGVPDNYDKGNRAVILDGEAFFTVTPATDTFTVTSNKLKATVLGTSFKMHSFSSQHGAVVYLLHGKVRVNKSYYSAIDNQPEILEWGQMVLANDEIDLMEKETYHPEELETWLSDTLIIKQVNSRTFSRILEEWFAIEVTLQGDVAKAPDISATVFYHASLKEVLDHLSKQENFKYKISKNKATITF